MKIRRAIPDDARAIAKMHARSWRAAYTGLIDDAFLNKLDPEEQARRMLTPETGYLVATDPRIAAFVATQGRHIIGWAATGPAREADFDAYGELYAVYVDPEHFGKGAGKGLFGACARHLSGHGYDRMYVRALRDNQMGCAFYARMGGRALHGQIRDLTIGGKSYPEMMYVWDRIGPPENELS